MSRAEASRANPCRGVKPEEAMGAMTPAVAPSLQAGESIRERIVESKNWIFESLNEREKMLDNMLAEVDEIIREVEDKDERDKLYASAIITLIQRFLGLDDEIDEIAIKGIDVFGEKYIILLRW
jgi:hypothetical protein